MRRPSRQVAAAVSLGTVALLLTAAPAAAHKHQIETPGGGDPIIGCEPFHGEDPSGGAILSNPNVGETAYRDGGLHPIHHFLHIGPGSDARAVEVVVSSTEC